MFRKSARFRNVTAESLTVGKINGEAPGGGGGSTVTSFYVEGLQNRELVGTIRGTDAAFNDMSSVEVNAVGFYTAEFVQATFSITATPASATGTCTVLIPHTYINSLFEDGGEDYNPATTAGNGRALVFEGDIVAGFVFPLEGLSETDLGILVSLTAESEGPIGIQATIMAKRGPLSL
jgi:hypothetical protein